VTIVLITVVKQVTITTGCNCI